MPKAFSEHEREVIKTDMLAVGADLIRKKGVRHVTVEEICKGANIAKGSFYAFFNSREELFWKIMKLEEAVLLEKIRNVASEKIDLEKKLKKFFYNLLLKDECIIFYLTQEDMQYIVRKLPPQLLTEDMENSENTLKTLLSLCEVNENHENVEILMSMIHTLQFVASDNNLITDKAREQMLVILVEAFIRYYCKED